MACDCDKLAAELAAIKALLQQIQGSTYTDEDAVKAVDAQLSGLGGLAGLALLAGAIPGLKKFQDELKPLNLPEAVPRIDTNSQAARAKADELQSALTKAETELRAAFQAGDEDAIRKAEDGYRKAKDEIRQEVASRYRSEITAAAADAEHRAANQQARTDIVNARGEIAEAKAEASRAWNSAVEAQQNYLNLKNAHGELDARTIAAKDAADTAYSEALSARKTAENLRPEIGRAVSTAEQAAGTASAASDLAGAANGKADGAAKKAADVDLDLQNTKRGPIADISKKASDAFGRASDAWENSRVAKGLAEVADSKAGRAFSKGLDAFDRATSALDKVAGLAVVVAAAVAAITAIQMLLNELSLGRRVANLEMGQKLQDAVMDRILAAMNALNGRIQALNAAVEAANRLSAEVRAAVERMESRFGDLREEINEDIAALQARMREITAEVSSRIAALEQKLSTDLARLEARFSEQISEIERVMESIVPEIKAAITGALSPVDKALGQINAQLAGIFGAINDLSQRLGKIEFEGIDYSKITGAISEATAQIIRNIEPLLSASGFYSKTTVTERSIADINREVQQTKLQIADLRGQLWLNLASTDPVAVTAQLNAAQAQLGQLQQQQAIVTQNLQTVNITTTKISQDNQQITSSLAETNVKLGNLANPAPNPTPNPTPTPAPAPQPSPKPQDIINPITAALGVAVIDITRQIVQGNTGLGTRIQNLPQQIVPPILAGGGGGQPTACRYDTARVNSIYQNTDEVEGLIRQTNTTVKVIDETTKATAATTAAHAYSWFQWLNNAWGAFFTKWEKFRDWMLNDRVINLLNLIFNLHNAMMLSANLAQSVVWAVDSVLRLFGVQLKDSEGNEVGLGQKISEFIENIADGLFGADNVDEAKAQFALLSTIYRSAVNVIYGVQGLFETMRIVVDTIASYVGRIGNALKRDAVVSDTNYQWMREDFWSKVQDTTRFERFYRGVENAETAVGSVTMVTGDVESVKGAVQSFDEQRDQILADVQAAQDAAGQIDPLTFERTGTGYAASTPLDSPTVATTEAEAALDSEPRVTLEDPEAGKP